MMIGVRVVYLGLAAILFGAAAGAPAPAPAPYNPQVGEIVHVAPQNTVGGSQIGAGGHIAHPAIVMSHPDAYGNYAVAPVTHGVTDHLKPHMPVPAHGTHGLQGVVQLDHITAHASNIQQSHGQFQNRIVSGGAFTQIQNAKGLVNTHHAAAHAHDQVGAAHRALQTHHDGLSSQAFMSGNTAAGSYHAGQANIHGGHADNHENAAATHRTNAAEVNGYDHHEANRAQSSLNHANQASAALAAASQNTANGNYYSNVGDHHTAQQWHNAAATSLNTANTESQRAVNAAHQAHH
jgi:hypothetical protein